MLRIQGQRDDPYLPGIIKPKVGLLLYARSPMVVGGGVEWPMSHLHAAMDLLFRDLGIRTFRRKDGLRWYE